jgi:sulfatase maturation enzyme AslB (radical SAM superfamily)
VRADLPGRFSELDVVARHPARVQASFEGVVLPPYEVLIHPSSTCNLRCFWCIGDHVPISDEGDQAQGGKRMLKVLEASKFSDERLADTLRDTGAMLGLVKGITEYRKTWTPEGGVPEEFRVENVSFSGLIGEPLVSKAATIAAMQHLVEADVRVGIFTNGILMDESTHDTILRIGYIHLSLDAGNSRTYATLKAGKRESSHFDKALANLRTLARRRALSSSKLELTASFILYPQNCHEVYDAAVILKEAGVDTLRIKRDISGTRLLNEEQRLSSLRLLQRVREELVDDGFKLLEIHQLDQETDLTRHFSTCNITNLMAAIGSDGHLYPCNYHPRPGGFTYGSAVDHGFAAIWEGAERMRLRSQLPHICPAVCDPFKNRANRLLAHLGEVHRTEGMDGARRLAGELAAMA